MNVQTVGEDNRPMAQKAFDSLWRPSLTCLENVTFMNTVSDFPKGELIELIQSDTRKKKSLKIVLSYPEDNSYIIIEEREVNGNYSNIFSFGKLP